jgi:hypothetical protein
MSSSSSSQRGPSPRNISQPRTCGSSMPAHAHTGTMQTCTQARMHAHTHTHARTHKHIQFSAQHAQTHPIQCAAHLDEGRGEPVVVVGLGQAALAPAHWHSLLPTTQTDAYKPRHINPLPAYLDEGCGEPVVVVCLGQAVLHNLLQDAGQAGYQLPAVETSGNSSKHVLIVSL